jgi:hypothetical protein
MVLYVRLEMVIETLKQLGVLTVIFPHAIPRGLVASQTRGPQTEALVFDFFPDF